MIPPTSAPASAPSPAGTASGKVTDKDGNAVAGARVIATAAPAAPARNKKAAKNQPPADGSSTQPTQPETLGSAITNKDGAFTLKNLPAGKMIVTANAKGLGRGRTGPLDVTIGQNTDAGVITLTQPAQRKPGGDLP